MTNDKAIQKGYTKRYLPEKAWASLSPEEREDTDQKKELAVNKANSSLLTLKKQREQDVQQDVTKTINSSILT